MNESVSKEKERMLLLSERKAKIDREVHVLILYQSKCQAGDTLINKTLFFKIHLRLFRARALGRGKPPSRELSKWERVDVLFAEELIQDTAWTDL